MEFFAKNLVTTQRCIVLAKKIEKKFTGAVTSRTLEAIAWVNTVHPGDLSRRERHLFWVLLAALRIADGADVIRCTLGHLVTVMHRVGLEGSMSTVRRALGELEERGFLRRRRCRFGRDRLGLLLDICRERWSYWLRPSPPNVTQKSQNSEPTSIHIPTHQSFGPGDDRRNISSRVDLPNSSVSTYNLPQSSSKKHLHHPIVYSLFRLLTRTTAEDRQALIKRAEAEIAAAEVGLEVLNHSGVPWEQFSKAWREMGVSAREPFAAAEIVPRLREALKPRPAETLDDAEELGHDHSDAGVELEQLVGNLGTLRDVGTAISAPPPTWAPRWFPGPSGPDEDGLSTPQTQTPPDAGVNLLDDETRAVLERARKRCRARACEIDD